MARRNDGEELQQLARVERYVVERELLDALRRPCARLVHRASPESEPREDEDEDVQIREPGQRAPEVGDVEPRDVRRLYKSQHELPYVVCRRR